MISLVLYIISIIITSILSYYYFFKIEYCNLKFNIHNIFYLINKNEEFRILLILSCMPITNLSICVILLYRIVNSNKYNKPKE